MKIPWIYYCLLLIGCSSTDSEKQMIRRQAATIHNEMIGRAELLEERIAEINSDTVIILPDSIKEWENEIIEWEQELVEVPGNEAHHVKEGSHHHDDHQQLQVTPEQMLMIQQDFKSRLQSIEDRVESAWRGVKKSF